MDGGYPHALRSSLEAYRLLTDHILYVAITAREETSESKSLLRGLPLLHLRSSPAPKVRRFLNSLTSRIPASLSGLFSMARMEKIEDFVRGQFQSPGKLWFIFEDTPLAIYLPSLRKAFPEAGFAIRSHNILSEIFKGLANRSPLPLRFCWRYEINKLRSFEAESLKQADVLWSITPHDASVYREQYLRTVDGVLGVFIDTSQYNSIPSGPPDSILYLGTADLRKRTGLQRFITRCWPRIRSQAPEARFLLAGSNTERFHNRDNRIFATGRCSSDAEFLAKGRYFVNPQESGSGIKIKSLVAMASGKLLISTPIGVEGIPTKNGAHCLISSSIDQMHEPLILCLSEPDRFARLGAQAKRLVSPRFSRSTFLDETLPQIREHLTQG